MDLKPTRDIFDMAELCVGVGMGRRLPLFIGEILGPSKGQFLFWGS